MRLLPILFLIFSCVGLGQELNNPNRLPPCPTEQNQRFHNCWGTVNWPNGDKYVGEFKNGEKHGLGTYYHLADAGYKGQKYIGEFENGDFHGIGTYLWPEGHSHRGHFKKMKPDGKGIKIEKNVAKSQGFFSDWNSGNLILEYATGAKYVGEVKNGLRHGRGKHYSENGSWFDGNYRDNNLEGPAIFFNSESGKYLEAIWKDNKLIRTEKVVLAKLVDEESLLYKPTDQIKLSQDSGSPASELQICQGTDKSKWYKCFGIVNEAWGSYIGEFENGVFQGKGKATFAAGSTYAGEFRDGKANGFGKYLSPKGEIYIGEFKDYMNHGKGILLDKNGSIISEGIFEFGKIVRAEKTGINLTSDQSEKLPHERASNISRLNLEISNTQPNSDGDFIIFINTNSDTSSLKINDEEFGGRSDGRYSINRVARAGQDTQFTVVAKDITGKSETKTITVSRAVVESKVGYAPLNPAEVKRQVERDAVAIIIGITSYRTLPKADFANDDARVFYDYAIRALGVKPENIKLLVDADAEEVEIIKAFKTWLPSRVKSTTDVYVFYSGHGLPTQDGQGLYLLPPRADRDFISRTSIQFQEINADLQAAKPKSVTIFMDACYSGQARSGETLVANARPVTLKAEKKLFPDNFTVITASQADQISSSSPDLKHGIFSYYLMKGMEGDADTNKDGKITLGEMQAYLVENVGRQAGMMSRRQVPQLIGDAVRVLVGQ